jgi:primosomal protein N' (replication factor Y)
VTTPGDAVNRVVRVAPDVPAIHRQFDYTVPESMSPTIRVGSRVRIDLHGRRVGAWVVEDNVVPPAGVEPKPISLSSGEGPPGPVVALAEWASWRWAGPLSSFLGTASPPRVVRRGVAAGSGLAFSSGPRSPDPNPVASPGGASVGIVAEALDGLAPLSVVRLAPALDASLIALELVHRMGPAGVLMLVPSLARASLLADRLRRAGAPVALLPDEWEAAASGERVVIGTRSAAWAPLSRVTSVVVLDAHDEAYREERSPTWSSVDVVIERGRRDRAPVVLVTPCPPVVLLEPGRLVTTDRAVERRGWPVVEVVDRTGDDPRTGLFSERLVQLLRSVLDTPSGRVVCILNRKGRARLLACAHCGALARCTRCGGPVAQKEPGGELRCRICDLARPAVCAECDSTRLKVLRIGVSRATEELSALAGVEAIELTGDSEAPTDAGSRLVVGTEAALHRVPRADAVIFLDFDQHLLAPRFGAGEEALALLARASRLVGGRQSGGRILAQTRIPDHEALRAAVHADPSLLAEPERKLREELALPPFGVLALLRGPGSDDYAEALRASDGLTVSASDPDRWLVRAADHPTLCDALASTPRPPGRLRVEVDPTDV